MLSSKQATGELLELTKLTNKLIFHIDQMLIARHLTPSRSPNRSDTRLFYGTELASLSFAAIRGAERLAQWRLLPDWRAL